MIQALMMIPEGCCFVNKNTSADNNKKYIQQDLDKACDEHAGTDMMIQIMTSNIIVKMNLSLPAPHLQTGRFI